MPQYTEMQDQGPKDFQRLELTASIAEDIARLKPYIRQAHEKKEPLINIDYSFALDCVKTYSAAFGDEGLSYLENKFNKIFSKNGYEKPGAADLKEIEKLIDRIETPEFHKSHNYYDKEAYNEFAASEKKGINGQAQNPPLEGRNFNSKDNIMSDLSEDLAEGKNLSPKELAFYNATHQRKVIADSLKNRTLCCLPGRDGYADTAPARNLLNDDIYQGANLLITKEHQRANGFPTGDYATKEQIERAQKDTPDLIIRKGQAGVSIDISVRKAGDGEKAEYEDKHIRLFNIAQLNKPYKFKEWAEQQQQQKKEEFWRSQYGSQYEPPELKKKGPGPEISCTSTDPEKYLGQYFAAVSMGGKFKASPGQGEEFSKKCVDSLYAKTIIAKTGKTPGEPISDPFKLSKISFEANKYCKEFMKGLRVESRKASQEQKQEQGLEPKRGRRTSR